MPARHAQIDLVLSGEITYVVGQLEDEKLSLRALQRRDGDLSGTFRKMKFFWTALHASIRPSVATQQNGQETYQFH